MKMEKKKKKKKKKKECEDVEGGRMCCEGRNVGQRRTRRCHLTQQPCCWQQMWFGWGELA
eukprot:CAMPEP_0206598386 /NCGR_PEP_ID=MMETSP0325_2-20121206/44617_1 /ASSEMBLY_ACC=CAM_ASM_000347 /TAXON_ID=2866 /ORGANISM="Crypthecodinium cohnii, Strain Seligo" /LENGTH=59 /DNA_ID=CAMNT_0054109385 /DNA_START=333 /DNA_END=509 /DNA_ORIENTATION=-